MQTDSNKYTIIILIVSFSKITDFIGGSYIVVYFLQANIPTKFYISFKTL